MKKLLLLHAYTLLQPQNLKVQRVAVSNTYRGQQLGQQLIEEIERFCQENQKNTLILNAQIKLLVFEKLGYHTWRSF